MLHILCIIYCHFKTAMSDYKIEYITVFIFQNEPVDDRLSKLAVQ